MMEQSLLRAPMVSMATDCSVVGLCYQHALLDRRDKIERLLIALNDEFADAMLMLLIEL
jgi:hypothetical protein